MENAEASGAAKIRVLVVDDSATVRSVLTRELGADPAIEVLGSARDGAEAIEKVAALRPDVVTLDVEMPRMDGIQALERIMKETPVPVLMVSSLTREGAHATIKALELGAVDFIAKTSSMGSAGLMGILPELIAKIKAASRMRTRRAVPPAAVTPRRTDAPVSAGDAARWRRMLVVVGSSTGGPQALRQLFTALPADLHVPILAVQHMPAGFTKALADRLNELGPLRCEEARPGSRIEPGKILLAPGGFHMVLRKNGEIELNQQPSECGVRPAVNVTMESVAAAWGRQTLGVILTGMGHDGTRGGQLMKEAGGEILAEDESTCVVYGMPRSAVEAGIVSRIVPLHKMAAAIADACRQGVAQEASA